MPVPEFPQSMGASGAVSFMDWPLMMSFVGPKPSSSSTTLYVAPRAAIAFSVHRQSSLGRKFETSHLPLERPPKIAARWEMLLSPGTLNSALSESMDLTRKLDMKSGMIY